MTDSLGTHLEERHTIKKNMDSYIAVYLVIPHRVFREGLQKLLEYYPDIKVLGSGGFDLQTLDRVLKARADVLLVSDEIPPLFFSILANSHPKKFLVISTSRSVDRGLQWLIRGAHGVVPCASGGGDLHRAIKGVVSGKLWAPRKLMHEALQRLPPDPSFPALSAQQHCIFLCLAQGLCDKDIMKKCGMSFSTLRTQLKRIYKKLGVSSRLEAISLLFKTEENSPQFL